MLTNPKKLFDLANTTTKAVTADSDLGSVRSLISFAKASSASAPSDMTMVTMPVRYDPANPNSVIVQRPRPARSGSPEADKPIPKSATKGTATGQAKGVVTS